jgi:hypothetical protein
MEIAVRGVVIDQLLEVRDAIREDRVDENDEATIEQFFVSGDEPLTFVAISLLRVEEG